MHCMAQITVRIPARLRKALDERARQTERRPSDIVRIALGEYLRVDVPRVRPAARVRGLVGSLASGVRDLAERHREHILESLRGR
jgi:metal-responsive CopG/Arc/MetJ family transcriptional regulator